MSDTPKTWGEMSDAEKGALLLAHHEGREIETHTRGLIIRDDWIVVDHPSWTPTALYRIKLEPKRETVTVYGHYNGGFFLRQNTQGDTHRITFDTIDGEPDCASVKMERIE